MAHIRQSRPDCGLAFQAKALQMFSGVPPSLRSGTRSHHTWGAVGWRAAERERGSERQEAMAWEARLAALLLNPILNPEPSPPSTPPPQVTRERGRRETTGYEPFEREREGDRKAYFRRAARWSEAPPPSAIVINPFSEAGNRYHDFFS